MAVKDNISSATPPQVLEDLAAAGHAVDFEYLRALVHRIWPPRALEGHRNRGGRPYVDRVAVVCAILASCNPVYGVVANRAELVRRLRAEDPEYRRRCGFTGAPPSKNTVERTHHQMLRNWPLFHRCFLDPPGGLLAVDHADNVSELDQKTVQKRKVYPRDWHAYNEAQTHEAEDVLELLGDISGLVNEIDLRHRPPPEQGRPRSPLGSMLFALIYKAFLGQSARRVHAQLRLLRHSGYLPKCDPSGSMSIGTEGLDPWIPCFNSINGYYGYDWLTPVLLELVTVTATPVRSLETDFTMDATGCSTHSFMRWVDHRTESEVKEHVWVKLHMMCGALTNVITRAAVTPSDVHDNVLFRELFLETVRHFHMRKLTADMGYLSGPNYALARDFGVDLYVPFKSNTAPWVDDGTAWSAALWDFLNRHDEFMDEYHQRSNAESTFSALKRKFPSQIRMKYPTGQVNETLCKVLAYNLSGVAREVRMRSVKPEFPSEVGRLERAVASICGG